MVKPVSYENMAPVQLALFYARKELCSLHGSTVVDGEAPTETFQLDMSETIKLIDTAVKNISKALAYAQYELDTTNGLIVIDSSEPDKRFEINTPELLALMLEASRSLDKLFDTNNIDCP